MRFGTGIDREEQALVPEVLVELTADHARLDHTVCVLGVNCDDAIHVLHVERDATERRIEVAFEGRAGPEWNHGHAVAGAYAHCALNFQDRLGEDHAVG